MLGQCWRERSPDPRFGPETFAPTVVSTWPRTRARVASWHHVHEMMIVVVVWDVVRCWPWATFVYTKVEGGSSG